MYIYKFLYLKIYFKNLLFLRSKAEERMRLMCNFILHCFTVQEIKQTSVLPTTVIFRHKLLTAKDFILTNHFNLIPYSLILLGLN